MGLLSKILGRDSDSDGDERPPKPEDKDGQKTVERTRYMATVEYRNGETETFKCYGIYSRGEDFVKFNTDPYGRQCSVTGQAEHNYDRRKVHYETLAREPELKEVATDWFILDYDSVHKWDYGPGYTLYHSSKEWHEYHENVSLTVAQNNPDAQTP